MFGQYQLLPLLRPFPGLLHAESQKFNDYLLLASQNDYYEVLVKSAQHPDFCGLSFLAPGMKWLKINGSIDAARVVEIANVIAQRFFDAYLREAQKSRFGPEQFPELQVRMNFFAREQGPMGVATKSFGMPEVRYSQVAAVMVRPYR